jgi:predicted ATPase/class 3 adenylate cyclase/tRNA A-37 threonylcarbamoyl transferase component Bud32
MITIPHYKILTQINESIDSIIYRGIREQDNETVILKTLKEEYPSPAKLAHYQQEYNILRHLDLTGVVKVYALEKHENTLIIIFEDVGGESLKQLMTTRQFSVNEFLSLAIQLTDILADIHAVQIIHKDINPGNIVWNQSTGQLKIIDFGISTILPRENPMLKNPNQLEGTLTYISPEQTGRMNRAMDYRTDFYALGATFYELLTHHLPFETEDMMELVHCHLAKQPVTPHELNPDIPPAVSDIIMKLLAKTAEERYQSAYGLKADLQACELGLEQGQLEELTLGTQDFCDKFRIPQKLYGRDKEIEILLSAFNRASQQRSELMLVAGYSGIGKSALVQEIYKPITEKRGYFIAGKFDQLQRNIPYSAVVNAFRDLMHQLMTEEATQLEQWREKILKAVGPNGQIIIDVIPEVQLIIDKQEAVPKLGPTEALNRFNLVFQNFIRVFCDPEHPLVIFLDDLQWADSASLNLMTLMMAHSQYLFLIGAYRDNEVDGAHPLTLTLEELDKLGVPIETLSLGPLGLAESNQLIADTLNQTLESTEALANLVLKKTGGNPFFMGEFLKQLYSERLIDFKWPTDDSQPGWQWDLTQIKARRITDNVIDLMVDKVQKLNPNTQQVLKLAACIGNQFDLALLAIVSEKTQQTTQEDLWEAITEEMVFQIDQGYKFVHDRVQQALYSLIPSEQKQAVHWQVGQLLLENTSADQREQNIFAIVDHLNIGRVWITQALEGNELASLNLIAGRKAKASAAYLPAFDYLKMGLDLLDETHWETEYDLVLALYTEAAEAAYLCNHFEDMEHWVAVVLEHAKTLLDKIKAYEIRIYSHLAQNRMLEAIDIALQVLKQLGISLPRKPKKWQIILALLQTKLTLGRKRIDALKELPEMTQPDKLAAMRILASVNSATYIAAPELFPLLVLKQVNLSIKHGNTVFSTYTYAVYGLILCGVLGDIDNGYQFGNLSITLLEKFNVKELKARTIFVVSLFIKHWKEHLRETLKPLLEAYQNGLLTGDLEYAAYAVMFHSSYSYLVGLEIVEIEREMINFNNIITQIKQESGLHLHGIYRQVFLNLKGNCDNYCILSGEHFDEEKMFPFYMEANNRNAIFHLYFNKLILCYLFKEYSQALENAIKAETYLDGVIGAVQVAYFYFYDSLLRLAIYPEISKGKQQQYRLKIYANQKKLKKWANHAPMNYWHKFYLVEAESARVFGKNQAAMEYYDQAIALASEHEYLNDEALANELAGQFYMTQGQEHFAYHYLHEAHYAYSQWGATAKVNDLETRYPRLKTNSESGSALAVNVTANLSSTRQTPLSALDFASALKASQAISVEIDLKGLLIKLMAVVIENAGAQRGCLILPHKGQWFIEAEGTVDQETVRVLQSIPIMPPQGGDASPVRNVPTTLINYMIHAKESVLLDQATHSGQWTRDPYIIENQVKSILAMPLLNQGKLTGLLYLENNLTNNAFTPERFETLQLLSSQIAISIENARFYQEITDLNKAYERFVPHQFLRLLNKRSVLEVALGDQVEQEMSILFSDIRGFTALSEKMTPQENFNFINAYLSQMEPIITEYQGFIDKYIGDAIMALFSGQADEAVQGAIAMLKQLFKYNQQRESAGQEAIAIGIGLNTGDLMLGTVGGQNRMDGTVISDAVNLASRIEGLTKRYGVALLISETTYASLSAPENYAIRTIDRVKVKGKSAPVTVYEVFDGDPADIIALKLKTRNYFEKALRHYRHKEFVLATQYFKQMLAIYPDDIAAQIYLKRCEHFQEYGVAENWEGVDTLESK